ncbi:Secreted LysM effector [Sphaerulina musiva]
MTYTVVSGDTFSSIAQGLGISVEAIEAANPGVSATNLQVGQILNVPAAAAGPIGSTKYTIKSGDTFWSISQAAGITVAEIEAANPGVPATNLQVDQVINIPAKSGGEGLAPPPPTISPPTTNGDEAVFQVSSLPTTGEYIRYSGPASNFPDPQTWAKYELLWEQNRQLMGLHNSESEIEHIRNAIEIVSKDSGVDARVIVCVIVQESGGNVRVRTTNNGVRNPGLMQSHNGVEFNPSDPQGSILQMIRDGTQGVAGPDGGEGLQQCFEAEERNWYRAFRRYNSGSVNQKELNDGRGATEGYVRDVANRLMGRTWRGM